MMKYSITAIVLACVVLSHSYVLPTVAFSTSTPPSPRLVGPSSSTALFGVRSRLRNVFRRGVKTLEPETAKPDTEKDEPPKQLWRLMYYHTDYMPESIARVLAKLVPSLDRRTAYELCCHARMAGKVPLLVTTQGDVERYRDILLQYGLKATAEPYKEIK
mmetsp:Transcript_13818/g.34719  ORF Transcript_13818/g.34719 Transcript_13818/m.34719 type:complete len:160 (-) Transcript_13818:19-498(-)